MRRRDAARRRAESFASLPGSASGAMYCPVALPMPAGGTPNLGLGVKPWSSVELETRALRA